MLCDILGVHQSVTAARNDHRHSRRKAGGIATRCEKKTILRFPVASEVLEHSQPPTAVSIFCRQFVPSSLCGCGAYDAFACCASLDFSLSLAQTPAVSGPSYSRSISRTCWQMCPTGKTSTRCSKIRERCSEVTDMDDFDSRTAGQHFSSPRRTMSDAMRLAEKRDEEALPTWSDKMRHWSRRNPRCSTQNNNPRDRI